MSEMVAFQKHCERMKTRAANDGRVDHANQWAAISEEITNYLAGHTGGLLSPSDPAAPDEVLDQPLFSDL